MSVCMYSPKTLHQPPRRKQNKKRNVLKFRNSLCLNQQLEVGSLLRTCSWRKIIFFCLNTQKSFRDDTEKCLNPSSFFASSLSFCRQIIFLWHHIKGREINYFYIFISLVNFFYFFFSFLRKYEIILFLEAFFSCFMNERREGEEKKLWVKSIFGWRVFFSFFCSLRVFSITNNPDGMFCFVVRFFEEF